MPRKSNVNCVHVAPAAAAKAVALVGSVANVKGGEAALTAMAIRSVKSPRLHRPPQVAIGSDSLR
jgi:hypothetical protein